MPDDLGTALYTLHRETGRLLEMLNRDGYLWTPDPDRLPDGLAQLPLMTAGVLVAWSRQPQERPSRSEPRGSS